MTETTPGQDILFVLTVIVMWSMFMILPTVAVTLTTNLQSHSLLIIYGMWGVSVLVCVGLMSQLKK